MPAKRRATIAPEASRVPATEDYLNKQGVTWEYEDAIPLSQFDKEKSLHNQARLSQVLSEEQVETYAEAMKRDDIFPAVIAYRPGKLLIPISNQESRAAAEDEPAAGVSAMVTNSHLPAGVTPTPPAADDPSTALLEAFLRPLRPSTKAAYAGDLADLGRFADRLGVPLLGLGRLDLEAWVVGMVERGLASATVARRLSAASGLFALAVDVGLLERSPTRRVRRPSVHHAPPRIELDVTDLRALLAAATALDDRVLVLLAAVMGLRVGELLGIDAADVELAPGRTTVTVTRKGGSRVRLRVPQAVADALAASLRGRRDGPLLVAPRGGRLGWSTATRRLRALGRQALGAERGGFLRAHRLRGAMIDALFTAGVTVDVTATAAGHSPTTALRSYARHDAGRAYDAVSRLAEQLHEPGTTGPPAPSGEGPRR